MNASDTPPLPDADTARCLLEGAVGQIRFARDYTLGLLQATPHEHWFRFPTGMQTNIAWQVGHLTVSQYGLLMFRIRGRTPEDLELIPGRFRKAYSRGSNPSEDSDHQPPVDGLLERFAEVFDRAMNELQTVEADVLLEPVDMPYAVFPIKLGAIMFCPLHEHIHAGQIGAIRRAHGLDPVR